MSLELIRQSPSNKANHACGLFCRCGARNGSSLPKAKRPYDISLASSMIMWELNQNNAPSSASKVGAAPCGSSVLCTPCASDGFMFMTTETANNSSRKTHLIGGSPSVQL